CHEVIEGRLFKRILAEESEYPSRTDLLAAWESYVLARQIACLGDCRADTLDELPSRLERQAWRDDESANRAHWASEFPVDTYLLWSPLSQEHTHVGDDVCVVYELGDLFEQFFPGIRPNAGRQINICGRHLHSLPFLQSCSDGFSCAR